MAKEHIIFDKTEIIAAVLNVKKPFMENIKYSDIIYVKFRMTEGGFLSKAQETIEIKTGKRTIVFEQKKEKAFWEDYKTKLKDFCARNRVSLLNELPQG